MLYLAQCILHLGKVGLFVEMRRHHPRENLLEDVGKAEEDDAGNCLLQIHIDIMPGGISGRSVAEASNEEGHEQNGG